MSIQTKIIEQFLRLYGNLSYQKIADVTDIQVTRVFRILNGAEMKLSEFIVFEKLILIKCKEKAKLDLLADRCSQVLSARELKEICEVLRDKLKVFQLDQLSSQVSSLVNE